MVSTGNLTLDKTGTHFTRGWVDLGAGLDGTENLNLQGFDLRTVRLAARRYTGYALPAVVKREPYISLNYSHCITKIKVMELDIIWVERICLFNLVKNLARYPLR